MADSSSPKRSVFNSTGVPGFEYRIRKDGSKVFYGWIPGRGRTKLNATTQRAARAEWDELRGKAGRGEQVIVPAKLKVEQVGDQWYADVHSNLRPAWARDCKRALDKVIYKAWGSRRVSSITPQDIINLDRKLRASGLSESTVGNYLKPARGLFEYAVLKGYIAADPFKQIPRGKLSSCNTRREHREWTTKDVRRLIEKAYELDARDEARAEYGLAIEFKLRTGGRLGEVLGARYGDIDFEAGVWIVSAQWTSDNELAPPKTHKSARRVPLAPDLVKKIAARKLRVGAGDMDFLFASNKDGKPISHSNFRRRGWNLAVKEAGLDGGVKVTPHDARHAFASEMADLGLTSADVAEVLGHTSATITERIYCTRSTATSARSGSARR
jgi:integrase